MSGKPDVRYVKDIDLHTVDDSMFGIDDVPTAANELEDIAVNFYLFGQSLGIKNGEMKRLRDNYRYDQKKGLCEVLETYADQNIIPKFRPPTWRKIVAAVSNGMGGSNHRLAKDFAKKHPLTVKVPTYQETSSEHVDVTTQRNWEEARRDDSAQAPPPVHGTHGHAHHRTAPEQTNYSPDQPPRSHNPLIETVSAPNLRETPHPMPPGRYNSTSSNYRQQQPAYPQQGQYDQSFYGNQQRQRDTEMQPAARPHPHVTRPPTGQQNEPYDERQQANRYTGPQESRHTKNMTEIVTGVQSPPLYQNIGRTTTQPPPSNAPYHSPGPARPFDNQPTTTPSIPSEDRVPNGQPLYVGINASRLSSGDNIPDSPEPLGNGSGQSHSSSTRRVLASRPHQGNPPQTNRAELPYPPQATRAQLPPQGNPPQATRAQLPPQGNPSQATRAQLPPQGSPSQATRAQLPLQGNSPHTSRVEPPRTHGAPPGAYNPSSRFPPNDRHVPPRTAENLPGHVAAMNIETSTPAANYSPGPAPRQQAAVSIQQQRRSQEGNAGYNPQLQGQNYDDRSNSEQYSQGGAQSTWDQGQWASSRNTTLSTSDYDTDNSMTNSTLYRPQDSVISSSMSESSFDEGSSIGGSSIGGPNSSSTSSNPSNSISQLPVAGATGNQPSFNEPGAQSMTKYDQQDFVLPTKSEHESMSTASESLSTFTSAFSSDIPPSHENYSQDHAIQHGASQHGANQHNTSQHGANQHNTSQHGANQHNTSQHGANQYGANQHNTSQRDANLHGASQYGASPSGQPPAAPRRTPPPTENTSTPKPRESFGRAPAADLIIRGSMAVSQYSEPTLDYGRKQHIPLSSENGDEQRQDPSVSTLPRISETVSQGPPQLIECATPPSQSDITSATAVKPDLDKNLSQMSPNCPPPNNSGPVPCSSVRSTVSELPKQQQQLPLTQGHVSSSVVGGSSRIVKSTGADTEEDDVRRKPCHYNQPDVTKAIIPPPGEEYSMNLTTHPEPVSSTSTMQHENEQLTGYQEGDSFSPSEAGGSTQHVQPSSMQHPPGVSEWLREMETLLRDGHEGFRQSVDGGEVSFQSFEALRLTGEDRFKKIPLTFELLSPHKAPRTISEATDYYPMDESPHGLALIINNEHFKKHCRREGTGVDEKNLIITFRHLGYNVEVHRDLTTRQIQELFREIKCRPDLSASDSFVCCILTHGESGRVIGADSRSVLIDTLTESLCASSCPLLKGKPKIFFVQACRGKLKCRKVAADNGLEDEEPEPEASDYSDHSESEKEDEVDGGVQVQQDPPVCQLKRAISRSLSLELDPAAPRSRVESDSSDIPDSADFFFGYATPSGQVAWRDLDHGSWYISELCLQLCTYSATKSLGDIMKKVTNGVGNRYYYKNYKQIPETTERLRRKVLF